jgi:cyanophycinase
MEEGNHDAPPRVHANESRPHDVDGHGTIILIGGACTPKGAALASFLDEANGGPIVGITAASATPKESARQWLNDFQSIGVQGVNFIDVARDNEALDTENAARINDAAAVFLGGGDQVKLVAALSGSRSGTALKEMSRRGGVVCGTSAGAAALTELTMAGGEIDEEGNLVEQYIGPGFGLLGYQCIVDTHFSRRRRLQRLFVVIASNLQLLGLGIDEDTALIVRGHVAEVVGAGGVTFVDGRESVRYDNAGDLPVGRMLTLSHLRVGIVGTHHHLNLIERELEVLVSGAVSPET